MVETTNRSPELQRRRRIEHLLMMGTKLVLLGMVGLVALGGPLKLVAMVIGAFLEVAAVVCFWKALRVWRGPLVQDPPQPYSELQKSMERLR